jgi:type II secretory pathway pseudopilin PulG
MRRGAPEVIVGILLVVLLSSYVVYTRRVVRDLRAEAQRSSRMYARVLRAQTDTSADAGTEALFDLTQSITAQGVPIIVATSRRSFASSFASWTSRTRPSSIPSSARSTSATRRW